jgi:hypothetical protein
VLCQGTTRTSQSYLTSGWLPVSGIAIFIFTLQCRSLSELCPLSKYNSSFKRIICIVQTRSVTIIGIMVGGWGNYKKA